MPLTHVTQSLGLAGLLFTSLIYCIPLGIAYILILKPIYNILFHPLRRYPGPKLWAATRIPYALTTLKGITPFKLRELHRQYGPIIRVAPNELSYSRPDAWKDIMGHRKQGESENGKDPVAYKLNARNLLGMPRAEHGQTRRVLSHAFSAKRMMEQQPIIQSYINLLFKQLKARSAGGSEPIDIVSWYNYTTFDVIGDLSFGESFHCLESLDMQPWVRLVFQNLKAGAYLTTCRYFLSSADFLLNTFFPKLVGAKKQHMALVRAKVAQRMALKTERPDFMDSMIRQEVAPLSQEVIDANANTLIVAGSETTATVLAIATYFLCKHPEIKAKVAAEVRSAVSSEDEIDMTNVQSLDYMLAVLNEAMRLLPAVPSGQVRRTPPEGATICGEFVPGDTVVGISQICMNHSEENFARPMEFHPERWLKNPNPVFQNDKKDAFNPFSYGSRDCIGKNLAYSEMRMILARMLFNYDFELDSRSENWKDQLKVFALWDKPPMYVYLKPRKD